MATAPVPRRGELFRHVSAEKAALYRSIMDVFAAAKRQFRLHLRPDEVRAEGRWPGSEVPSPEAVQQALAQLVEWGNLEAQPDTARVQSIEDFYRARFLYRLSAGGEAVESALETFELALARRGELQSVALEDILARLQGLEGLARDRPLDAAKIHEAMRDLIHVFTGLAENAQAFMTGVARSLEVQRAEVEAVMAYKTRLVGYLERFVGDLVTRSGRIARLLARLEPRARAARLAVWRERWGGLRGWFVPQDRAPAQAELLRARARAAIPQLLAAVTAINERRAGRSDRAADFRVLARWFAEAFSEADAHRLWRAAFALGPARHLALAPGVPAGSRCARGSSSSTTTTARSSGSGMATCCYAATTAPASPRSSPSPCPSSSMRSSRPPGWSPMGIAASGWTGISSWAATRNAPATPGWSSGVATRSTIASVT